MEENGDLNTQNSNILPLIVPTAATATVILASSPELSRTSPEIIVEHSSGEESPKRQDGPTSSAAVPLILPAVVNMVEELHAMKVTISALSEAGDWTTDDEDEFQEPAVDEDEEDAYTPAAVCKLRALAHVVMINLRWAKDIRRGDEYKGFETTCKDHETGETKPVFFKVTDFLANKRITSGLTDTEKESLRLHPIGRSQEDVQNILKIFERYKCFEKFTSSVREGLAVWVRYDSFDDSRVLLRQGHEPYAMFFVLAGSINFKASHTDPRTGRTNNYPLGVRGPSSIIGEIELLNNDHRRSTGITQGDVELLRVDEEPFNDILRASFEAILDERFAALRSAQTFSDWTDAELRILNENSSVISFDENKSILSDVFGPSAFTYFVQKGRCNMVKDVVFERSFFGPGHNLPLYQALDPDDQRRWISPPALQDYPELEGHHLNITEFKEGDYFGVGEDLRRTHIVSITMVELLTIPRSVFEKANRIQFLDDLKSDLEDAIPSEEQVLGGWLALQTWDNYKKSHLKSYYQRIKADEDFKFFNIHRKWR